MDLISSNTGNGDGEIPSSNPIYTDFDQKRQTSDHGESIHIQIQLLAKIASYLVNIGRLICLASLQMVLFQ